jgi:peptidoglycan/LPS O-acetylase OafA/YrhL
MQNVLWMQLLEMPCKAKRYRMSKIPYTYYPQLNALRGLGVLSVFFYHAYTNINFGSTFIGRFLQFIHTHVYFSMDMFFALSAFIITHLAFAEYTYTNNFSFKNFIVRRVLRIWPLYFLLLIITYFVMVPLSNKYNFSFAAPEGYWYFLFIANFIIPEHLFYLRQLWSISVEEQFYVFWGAILLWGFKYVKAISVFGMAIGFLFCLYVIGKPNLAYYHTLVYAYPLMVGALFAKLLQKNSFITEWAKQKSTIKTSLIYGFIPVFFLAYFFLIQLLPHYKVQIGVFMRLLYVTHHCLLFVDQMYNTASWFNLARARFLIYIGKISYGVYCWHGLVLSVSYFILEKYKIALSKEMYAILTFILVVLIGTISYNYFELPFLKLKTKLKITAK